MIRLAAHPALDAAITYRGSIAADLISIIAAGNRAGISVTPNHLIRGELRGCRDKWAQRRFDAGVSLRASSASCARLSHVDSLAF